MQDGGFYFGPDDIEDISSSTTGNFQNNRVVSSPAATSKVPGYSSIGTVVKTIAFVVAFAILILNFTVAFFLFSPEPLYMAISIGIIILGIIFALIFMFLIYALGHLITQNNEILKRLNGD